MPIVLFIRIIKSAYSNASDTSAHWYYQQFPQYGATLIGAGARWYLCAQRKEKKNSIVLPYHFPC